MTDSPKYDKTLFPNIVVNIFKYYPIFKLKTYNEQVVYFVQGYLTHQKQRRKTYIKHRKLSKLELR